MFQKEKPFTLVLASLPLILSGLDRGKRLTCPEQ